MNRSSDDISKYSFAKKAAADYAKERKRKGHDDKKLCLDPKNPLHSARIFVENEHTADRARILHHYRGSFYAWDGSSYREAEPSALRTAVWTFLENAQWRTKSGGRTAFQPKGAHVNDVIDALAAVCHLPSEIEPPEWLEDIDGPAPRELLPVANGLLHLPTGELWEPAPALFCINATDVVFDDQAPAPSEWLKFLTQLWPADAELIACLQEWFGLFLSPDTSQQKILLIVGPRRAGKGTIARLLKALVGDANVVAPTLAGLGLPFGLQPLIGKSVAIISDARLSERADLASIAERLLSISGEDSVTVDRKHSTAWTGRLPTRFAIMTNMLPQLTDESGALAARFVVLILRESFLGREDRHLADRLLNELPGLLNWACVGYRRLHQRGYFKQPESAAEAAESISALTSPVTVFIDERCDIGPALEVVCDALFLAWKNWCGINGYKRPGDAQVFGRNLRAVLPWLKTARPREGEERPRKYLGIGLKA